MKRKNRDTPGIRIAQAIIAHYKPKSVAEMESYLGYEPNSREEKGRRTGVTATSTRLSKLQWARQKQRVRH